MYISKNCHVYTTALLTCQNVRHFHLRFRAGLNYPGLCYTNKSVRDPARMVAIHR